MFRYTSLVVLLVVGTLGFHLTTGVAAALSGMTDLAKRQTGTIPSVPAQCATTCNPVNTVLESNTCSPSTCCVATFEQGYFNCFKCVFGLVNLTDFSQPQSFVDLLIDECASEGIALPHLTFPGQNATRALSSVASVATTASQSLSVSLSGSAQSTVTSVSFSSTSTFVQSTVSAVPTSTSPNSTPSPTGTSNGFKAADSTFGSILFTIVLTICFYLAL